MNARIIAAIDNVHMGLSHDGLTLLAKKFKVDARTLGQHELVIFINRARNKLKILGGGGKVIAYTRSEKSRKLPLDAIQYIAQIFNEKGHIDIDAAIERHVTKALQDRTEVNAHYVYKAKKYGTTRGELNA